MHAALVKVWFYRSLKKKDAKMMNYILTIMETTVSGTLRTLAHADYMMVRA